MMKYLDLKKINDLYSAEIHSAVEEVLHNGWYLKGEITRRFESHYAEYIGTRFCVGCGNGLDALTLILRGYMEMGLMAEGDEVIVPANTFIASILAISACGLKPVLVEPRFETLQIDDECIESAITERTRAVMIVHLYGFCAYSERIKDICANYGLKLIEDNAQAHGCTYKGRRTGSLGDAAGHSFYPGKNLGALGDGGAITTDDEQLAQIVTSLGNYGSCHKYVFDHIGRNSRLDEIQAAILDVKLKYLDEANNRRKQIAGLYINNVRNPMIQLPPSGRECVWHIFPVFSIRRDELQKYLKDFGVETQVHYPIPPHRQKCYESLVGLHLPITERIHAQELSIPCNQVMTKEETDMVIGLLNDFL